MWNPQKTNQTSANVPTKATNLTRQNGGGLVETSPGSIQSRSLRNPSPLQSSSARYCRESHRHPRPQQRGWERRQGSFTGCSQRRLGGGFIVNCCCPFCREMSCFFGGKLLWDLVMSIIPKYRNFKPKFNIN